MIVVVRSANQRFVRGANNDYESYFPNVIIRVVLPLAIPLAIGAPFPPNPCEAKDTPE